MSLDSLTEARLEQEFLLKVGSASRADDRLEAEGEVADRTAKVVCEASGITTSEGVRCEHVGAHVEEGRVVFHNACEGCILGSQERLEQWRQTLSAKRNMSATAGFPS